MRVWWQPAFTRRSASSSANHKERKLQPAPHALCWSAGTAEAEASTYVEAFSKTFVTLFAKVCCSCHNGLCDLLLHSLVPRPVPA